MLENGHKVEDPKNSHLYTHLTPAPSDLTLFQQRLDRWTTQKLNQLAKEEYEILTLDREVTVTANGTVRYQSIELESVLRTQTLLLELRHLFVDTDFNNSINRSSERPI